MYMSNASTFVVETVTLESAVEGKKSGKEFTLEVDEPKHVDLEKMNGMNHTQTRNYISCPLIKDWHSFWKKCKGL